MAARGPNEPPPGVETTPTGPVVSLYAAAPRLGKDWRTLKRAIIAGDLRGGASQRGQRLRWYVYEDQLPSSGPAAGSLSGGHDAQQLATQMQVNRLILGAQQNLLEAQEDLLAGNAAAERYRAAARGYHAAAQKYRDALALLLAPEDPGELLDQL
jgi:hypothetical protein